tara:strand:- start:44 stop:484 length:441 start_codon:yes stop_codon:yes gene_type:complete
MADVNLRLLYLMDNPHGGNSVKVGSSGLAKYQTRIGNYQQGNGPDYLVTWPICYIGEESIINRLEERIKDKLEQDRLESRLGEWYDNHTAETIAPKIEEIIEGNHFKIKKVEKKFLPIAYEVGWKTQKRMLEYYQKKSILSDFLIG